VERLSAITALRSGKASPPDGTKNTIQSSENSQSNYCLKDEEFLLNVQIADVEGVVFDELTAGFYVFAH
jgi:hypothetical protein